jgi:nitroreductase
MEGVDMSHLENYNKPIDETIKSRVSCRTYQDRLMNEGDKAALLEFCRTINHGLHDEKIVFHLIEYSLTDLKKRKLAGYGIFKNARSFIMGIIEKSEFHNISYGFALEHMVLKATEMGLSTCWIGDFDPYLIKDVPLTSEQAIPAICVIGYAAYKKSLIEKTTRFVLKASRRKDWSKLFFDGNFQTPLTHDSAGRYTEALELLRLAPSSGNTQPWRVVKDKAGGVFHFYKKVAKRRYEKMKLQDIDIGIAMCHFEFGVTRNKLHGRWQRKDPDMQNIPRNTHYMVSWAIEG